MTFKDDAGRQFKWKGNAPGLALEVCSRLPPSQRPRPNNCYLQLFSEDDKFAQPIARFHRSRKDNRTDPPGQIPATLVLAPRAVEIQDLVVSSFLFLDRARRISETSYDKWTQNMVLVERRDAVMAMS